jgi:putative SOS response-associated peptidase YedK
MWRNAFKSRRCIIPASGFYEWTGTKSARIPHYFTARSGEPLAFAGLWESWRDPAGAELLSATIVVRAANAWMSTYHARQPMILKWRDVNAWVAGDNPAALLRPVREDALREWIVSTRVNKAGVGDDDPALIDAARQTCCPDLIAL